MSVDKNDPQLPMPSVRYSVSGVVAHDRIAPLVPPQWINTTDSPTVGPDFLWENAPRRESQQFRDTVSVYSHLPNGTSILDSKWVLGRLFAKRNNDPLLATLETHCFRGVEGFQEFCERVKLLDKSTESPTASTVTPSPYETACRSHSFPGWTYDHTPRCRWRQAQPSLHPRR